MKPQHTLPRIRIVPFTVHAALDKAAHYFNIKLIHIQPNTTTGKVDLGLVEKSINSNTIMVNLRKKLASEVQKGRLYFLLPFHLVYPYPRFPSLPSLSLSAQPPTFLMGSLMIFQAFPN